MLDWVDIPLGSSQTFNGVVCRVEPDQGAGQGNGQAFLRHHHHRPQSAFGYNKGTTAFMIDDADGTTWIMKGFELGIKPTHTFEQFSADPTSYFKKLPQGWKFRTKVLDQDLKLVPETGVATIMPDEMFNVYDKTGPGYSSYKP